MNLLPPEPPEAPIAYYYGTKERACKVCRAFWAYTFNNSMSQWLEAISGPIFVFQKFVRAQEYRLSHEVQVRATASTLKCHSP